MMALYSKLKGLMAQKSANVSLRTTDIGVTILNYDTS